MSHTGLLRRRGARAAGGALLGALLLAGGPAGAAVVTVTDCVNDPNIVVHSGTSTTRINVGSDDLVIACALSPVGGTKALDLAGANVTIQGPAGSLRATAKGKAIKIAASGTFTAVDTSIEATDGNAGADIVAAGDMLFDDTAVTVGGGSGGDLLLITCTGSSPACTITATNSSFTTRELDMIAVGDIVLSGVTITTSSPRDRTEIISLAGNVRAGATTSGGQQVGGKCDGDTEPGETERNVIIGGPESDLVIQAFGFVDLRGIRITVAQNITVTSGVGAGPASVPAYIDLTNAIIRNDIGKKGEIVMVADETNETITIEGTTLIDDDEQGGVNDVAELNGCEIVPRTTCTNVVGTPAIDS